MKMPSTTQGTHFSRVPKVEIQRSQFDRSFGIKTTLDAGNLVPLFWDEVLPGDTVNLSMNLFGRLSTPIKPIMDNIYLDWFAFFTPDRLVWDNFERFMGMQDSPGASTDFLIPVVSAHDITLHSLSDYFGLPRIGGSGAFAGTASALPFRAYNLIYNEWFRDQNLIAKVPVPLTDGPDDPAAVPYALLKRGKRADYFTSCLPFPQKGTAVSFLGTAAGAQVFSNSPTAGPTFKNGAATGKSLAFATATSTGAVNFSGGATVPSAGAVLQWENPNLVAALSTVTGTTVNDLRRAVQVQRLFEREARGGTRYVEWLKSMFGVTNPDFRLQRPEFLASGSVPVNVSPVAQTQRSDVAPATPQGNLAGIGTVSMQSKGFAKSFTEHGTLMVIVSVRADLNYQQNLLRKWTRRTKLDRAMPVTAHLGEQAVMRSELYWTQASDEQVVFGYQERFAEYRTGFSQITGLFRSQVAGTLDIWHLAQNFSPTPPTLGASFIYEDPPIDRVIAVPTEPHFLLDGYCKATWARCLPTYSVPGMMDHF